jgi:hypothetical protein
VSKWAWMHLTRCSEWPTMWSCGKIEFGEDLLLLF